MRNAALYSVGWLTITTACLSGCQSFPKIETCIIGETGLICIDPRKPEGEREYERAFPDAVNYIATNAQDFQTLKEYCERRGQK